VACTGLVLRASVKSNILLQVRNYSREESRVFIEVESMS
jgi:hypothetical protein